jgi:hypothetical protein
VCYNIDGFFWGSAMDSIMFAKQSFLEVGESLVLHCESNNDVEAHATIDKGVVACGVFSNVHIFALRMMKNLLKKGMSWFKLLRNAVPNKSVWH